MLTLSTGQYQDNLIDTTSRGTPDCVILLRTHILKAREKEETSWPRLLIIRSDEMLAHHIQRTKQSSDLVAKYV